jgi:hypothetical protein
LDDGLASRCGGDGVGVGGWDVEGGDGARWGLNVN